MFEKLATSSSFSLFIGVIGIVLSAASILYSIYINKKDKVNKRAFNEIAKIVNQNLEKKDREEELKLLSEKLANLNNTINIILPNEAKKAVLKDKLEVELESLANSYNNIQTLKDKIENLGDASNDIPKEFMDKISIDIEPRYLRAEKLSKLSNTLFILSFMSSIISQLSIHPLDNILMPVFALLELFIVIRILSLNIKTKNSNFVDKRLITIGLSIALLMVSIFSTMLTVIFISEYIEFGTIPIFLLITFSVISLLMWVGLVIIIKTNMHMFKSLFRKNK